MLTLRSLHDRALLAGNTRGDSTGGGNSERGAADDELAALVASLELHRLLLSGQHLLRQLDGSLQGRCGGNMLIVVIVM